LRSLQEPALSEAKGRDAMLPRQPLLLQFIKIPIPALRKVREGRGTPCPGRKRKVKSPATRPGV